MKTIDTTQTAIPVTLEQHTNGRFRVTYGSEVEDNLNYADAAHIYVECLFHSLICAGAFYPFS